MAYTKKPYKATDIASGNISDTEFSYLDGVTSNIQTQINGKANTSHTHTASDITNFNTSVDARIAAANINDLNDVTITAPASGEYIRHNGTAWVDSTIQAADLPSAIDAAKIANGNVSNTEFQFLDGVTSAIQTQLDGKQATLTNGFGITGTTTKAVALTTAEAFCTAETTLSAVTYADITGASVSLAAGTWLILATVNGASQTTTVAVMMAAITDGSNAVIAESSQHIVAGTATVRTWGSLSLSAIVSPSGTTTYKLRGARGTTTQTGNWIASDGNGVNTANNVSNNSDKGTSIRAIRIA